MKVNLRPEGLEIDIGSIEASCQVKVLRCATTTEASPPQAQDYTMADSAPSPSLSVAPGSHVWLQARFISGGVENLLPSLQAR